MTADFDEVRTGYDAWAKTYDATDNPLIAQAFVALEERAAWFAGADVLELGCGTGRNARFALSHGARRYVGIDASPGMLAEAKKIVDSRVAWIEGELTTGVEQDAFDVVLVCLVLEHVRDIGPVIAAASRALRRGGRLLVLELHPELHARGVGANFHDGDRETRLPSFRHDAIELAAACSASGFDTIETVDHRPSEAALATSPKLQRYASDHVLLELAASRT